MPGITVADCISQAARIAILTDLADRLLDRLPRTGNLPFALTYAADAVYRGVERFRAEVGPDAPAGTRAEIALGISHEFDFYGVSATVFHALVDALGRELHLADGILAEYGLAREGTDFLRHAALRALGRFLDDAARDDRRVVNEVVWALPANGEPADDDVVRGFLRYMAENAPYGRRQAVALACRRGFGRTLTSTAGDYDQIVGAMATALDAIAREGLPGLDLYHLHLLAAVFATLGRQPPSDLDRRRCRIREELEAHHTR